MPFMYGSLEGRQSTISILYIYTACCSLIFCVWRGHRARTGPSIIMDMNFGTRTSRFPQTLPQWRWIKKAQVAQISSDGLRLRYRGPPDFSAVPFSKRGRVRRCACTVCCGESAAQLVTLSHITSLASPKSPCYWPRLHDPRQLDRLAAALPTSSSACWAYILCRETD